MLLFLTADIRPWGGWRDITWMNHFTTLTILAVFSGLCLEWQSSAGRWVVYIKLLTLGEGGSQWEKGVKKKKMWKDICVVILLILDFDFVWKWNHLPRTGDTYPHSLLASNTFHIKIQTSKNQGSRKVRLSSELTSVTGYSLTDDNVQHLWVNHIFALTFFWHCCSCNSILSDFVNFTVPVIILTLNYLFNPSKKHSCYIPKWAYPDFSPGLTGRAQEQS